MRKTALFMSLMLVGTTPAWAQSSRDTCLADVERLADALGMNAQPPQGSAGSGDLAQSGGVIRPPDVGTGRVMEPPPGVADGMNTAPAIPPQTAGPDSGRGSEASRQSLGAAEQAQMESLLTGARNAARDGDTARCVETLEEARDLARESGVDTPM
jgi:hypothetical protein